MQSISLSQKETLIGTATTHCFKLKEKPTNCPKATDPDIAPIRHFDTITATSDKVCVKNDSRANLCPFKKVSLGVFEPDTTSPLTNAALGDIAESQDPIPPVECKEMGSVKARLSC